MGGIGVAISRWGYRPCPCALGSAARGGCCRSVGEWVPAGHPVRFIAEFVDQLVPSELGLSLETAPRGGASYDPRMMLAAWLYGYMTRIRQARRLEVAARENLPLIWLLGGEHPDHRTLSGFLAANHQVVAQLFKRTVRTAVEVGLVEFAFQAVDSTRVGAVSPDKMRGRATVEPVFGILREHLGLARFLHRGLAKVRAEWQLLCAAFNLRVLWKAWWLKRQVAAAA